MHYDWDNEIKWLEYVEQVIMDEVEIRTGKNVNYTSVMRTINKEMWEEVGPLSGQSTFFRIPAFLQEINLLKNNSKSIALNNIEIKKLEKQISSPYFGRVDFKEADCPVESIYIGIYGLRKSDNNEIIIYDWRAPVSSIFYDYEPGTASYKCPAGFIEGEMVLKRQYRIENGRLLLMFDSSAAIEDHILQDILAGSADTRMKTIVNTIQREQNHAIRCDNRRVLSIQGAAGSGKTSIALHRAAYLLYRDRNSIKAENIRLFTPSGIFAQYISNILPELGEDEIPCSTLTGLVQGVLGDTCKKYETYPEMMEWQLLHKNQYESDNRMECMGFKASQTFTSILENYAKYFENEIIHFDDIIAGNTLLASKKELTELFYSSYLHMPVAKRLSRMELHIMKKVNEYVRNRRQEKTLELADSGEHVDGTEMKISSRLIVAGEMESTMKKIKSMLSINIANAYINLFKDPSVLNACAVNSYGTVSDKLCKSTVEALENEVLLYEDQSPMLYLMLLLGMLDDDSEVKHLMIDEAQDYSYITYKLFSKIYPECGITLLGDACQNINPANGIGNLKLAGELLDSNSLEYIELEKSYRSTIEIMNFASQVYPAKATPFGRHGRTPEIMKSATMEGVCDLITNCTNDAKEDNFASIAVICRTTDSCHRVFQKLDGNMPVTLVKSGDDELQKGIVVIPSYLAKGLEFDAVIAAVLSADEYASGEDQLFYTVCTRALHRLDVCSVVGAGILSKFNS
ncbi:MAG: RNA polymerase recycling motor HelD [Clostridiaceae bacterium]